MILKFLFLYFVFNLVLVYYFYLVFNFLSFGVALTADTKKTTKDQKFGLNLSGFGYVNRLIKNGN